jgi:hypothetical protein
MDGQIFDTDNSSNEIGKMKVVQKSVQLNTLNITGATPFLLRKLLMLIIDLTQIIKVGNRK